MVCDFEQSFAFRLGSPNPVARDHALLRYRFLTAGGLTLAGAAVLSRRCIAVWWFATAGAWLFWATPSPARARYRMPARAPAGPSCPTTESFWCADRSDRYAVGDPYTLRLREDARELFPELAGSNADRRVPTAKLGHRNIHARICPFKSRQACSIDHIVFLNRNEPGPARIQPLSQGRCAGLVRAIRTFGTREARAAQSRCYQRLLSAGVWEMQYSDLDDAIARLEQLVDLPNRDRRESVPYPMFHKQSMTKLTGPAGLSCFFPRWSSWPCCWSWRFPWMRKSPPAACLGDVRDEKGASVEGVAIQASNNATGFSRNAVHQRLRQLPHRRSSSRGVHGHRASTMVFKP